MGKQNSKNEGEQKERRFSQEQYGFLKKCSEKGEEGIKEWNEWRKKNPDKDILLEGRDFSMWLLKGAYLNTGTVVDDDTNAVYEFSGKVHLENANFIGTDLSDALLIKAHLEGTKFSKLFDKANLKGARLGGAYLQGARFNETNLEGADFRLVVVDGSTSFWKCKVNKHYENNPGTNFEGVALGNVRIDAKTRQLLEYNIRRRNWEWWYEEHTKLRWVVKPFWRVSDYGLSTGRIIFTFFGLVFVFANIYYHWGRIAPPGIVNYLFVDRNGFEVQWWLVPLRTLYFSIVTMTTLGFGDMYANAHSIWGHILLSLQVILGYVLLGALITRFAVLFTAGGPAGKFAESGKGHD
jgi:hypothetical protein